MDFAFFDLASGSVTGVVAGFAVGLIVGLTGVGGGSLMTPLMLTVFQQPLLTAIGTDLWFAALTKAGGSVAHARAGHVRWDITRQLLTGSLPAAVLTLAVLHLSGGAGQWVGSLKVALGVALLLTAASLLLKPWWRNLALRLDEQLSPQLRPVLTIAAGALLGSMVTLTSIGAGAFGAVLIALLYPRLHAREVVGIDVAHAVPLTLVAGIGHAWMGHVNWGLLAVLLVGSLPGIWIGAQLTRRLPEHWVRNALCGTLVLAGWKVVA